MATQKAALITYVPTDTAEALVAEARAREMSLSKYLHMIIKEREQTHV